MKNAASSTCNSNAQVFFLETTLILWPAEKKILKSCARSRFKDTDNFYAFRTLKMKSSISIYSILLCMYLGKESTKVSAVLLTIAPGPSEQKSAQ